MGPLEIRGVISSMLVLGGSAGFWVGGLRVDVFWGLEVLKLVVDEMILVGCGLFENLVV